MYTDRPYVFTYATSSVISLPSLSWIRFARVLFMWNVRQFSAQSLPEASCIQSEDLLNLCIVGKNKTHYGE